MQKRSLQEMQDKLIQSQKLKKEKAMAHLKQMSESQSARIKQIMMNNKNYLVAKKKKPYYVDLQERFQL